MRYKIYISKFDNIIHLKIFYLQFFSKRHKLISINYNSKPVPKGQDENDDERWKIRLVDCFGVHFSRQVR